jgi:serine/threonine protein kinase
MEEEIWIGPYQCIKLLGSGGSAEVHLARHGKSEELVALKVLHEFIPEEQTQMRKRFLEEVEIVGRAPLSGV